MLKHNLTQNDNLVNMIAGRRQRLMTAMKTNEFVAEHFPRHEEVALQATAHLGRIIDRLNERQA